MVPWGMEFRYRTGLVALVAALACGPATNGTDTESTDTTTTSSTTDATDTSGTASSTTMGGTESGSGGAGELPPSCAPACEALGACFGDSELEALCVEEFEYSLEENAHPELCFGAVAAMCDCLLVDACPYLENDRVCREQEGQRLMACYNACDSSSSARTELDCSVEATCLKGYASVDCVAGECTCYDADANEIGGCSLAPPDLDCSPFLGYVINVDDRVDFANACCGLEL